MYIIYIYMLYVYYIYILYIYIVCIILYIYTPAKIRSPSRRDPIGANMLDPNMERVKRISPGIRTHSQPARGSPT